MIERPLTHDEQVKLQADLKRFKNDLNRIILAFVADYPTPIRRQALEFLQEQTTFNFVEYAAALKTETRRDGCYPSNPDASQ